jgi:hypothetical protein
VESIIPMSIWRNEVETAMDPVIDYVTAV